MQKMAKTQTEDKADVKNLTIYGLKIKYHKMIQQEIEKTGGSSASSFVRMLIMNHFDNNIDL